MNCHNSISSYCELGLKQSDDYNMKGIEVRINSVSLNTLINFYNENDIFNPPLSSQVTSIEEYIMKLKNNAVIFEAWDNNELVGLVAAYLNNYETKIGFITSVIVSQKYQKQGIAKRLLKKAVEFAKDKGFEEFHLKVHRENIGAINLYKKNNFSEDKKAFTGNVEIILFKTSI